MVFSGFGGILEMDVPKFPGPLNGARNSFRLLPSRRGGMNSALPGLPRCRVRRTGIRTFWKNVPAPSPPTGRSLSVSWLEAWGDQAWISHFGSALRNAAAAIMEEKGRRTSGASAWPRTGSSSNRNKGTSFSSAMPSTIRCLPDREAENVIIPQATAPGPGRTFRAP